MSAEWDLLRGALRRRAGASDARAGGVPRRAHQGRPGAPARNRVTAGGSRGRRAVPEHAGARSADRSLRQPSRAASFGFRSRASRDRHVARRLHDSRTARRRRHGRGLPRPRYAARSLRRHQGAVVRARHGARRARAVRTRGARDLEAVASAHLHRARRRRRRRSMVRDVPYLVMELLDGETLAARIARVRSPSSRRSPTPSTSPTRWSRRTARASCTAT